MKAEILPPLTATLHVKPAGWRIGFRLWLPLFLLWLLLLPLVILALPLLFIASLIFRVKPAAFPGRGERHAGRHCAARGWKWTSPTPHVSIKLH